MRKNSRTFLKLAIIGLVLGLSSVNGNVGEVQTVVVKCASDAGPTPADMDKALKQLKIIIIEDYIDSADPARKFLLEPLRSTLISNPDAFLEGFTKSGSGEFNATSKSFSVSAYSSLKFSSIDRLIDAPGNAPDVKRNPIVFIFVARRQTQTVEHSVDVETTVISDDRSSVGATNHESNSGFDVSAQSQVKQGITTSSQITRRSDTITYDLETQLKANIDRSFSEILVDRQFDVAAPEEIFDASDPESNLDEISKDFQKSSDFSIKHRKHLIEICREKAPVLAYGTLTLGMKRLDPSNPAITLIDVMIDAQVLDCRGALSIKVASIGNVRVTGTGIDQTSAERNGLERAAAKAANAVADQLRRRRIQ
jgi:hypothetical protein